MRPRKAMSAAIFFLAVLNVIPADAAPGRLDPSFGARGLAKANFGGYETGNDLAVQRDGKILLTAATVWPDGATNVHWPWMVARFDARGRLDKSFGRNGVVSFNSILPSGMYEPYEAAEDLAVDPARRVVLAGNFAREAAPYAVASGIAVARLLPNGRVDESFGAGGVTTIPTNAGASVVLRALAVQSDGKIIVAGMRGAGAGVPLLIGVGTTEFFVARLTSEGVLDPIFGTGGLAPVFSGSPIADQATSLALLPNGGIVVGGSAAARDDVYSDFAVARLTADGIPDLAFGENGVAVVDVGEEDAVHSMIVQPDGKILVAGETVDHMRDRTAAVLIRLRDDGTLDTSFGRGGKVGIARPGPPAYFWEVKIALAGDRRIIVSDGTTVRRLLADGRADRSFGLARSPRGYANYTDVAVQPNGRILVATGRSYDAVVAGYLPR